MTEHETHVIKYRGERHAYCTCGWLGMWMLDDDSARKDADNHERKATA